MFTLLAWILFGIVVGVIIHFLMTTRRRGSLPVSVVLGIIGALCGGVLARIIFGFGFKVSNSPENMTIPSAIISIITAIVGAFVLDVLYRVLIDTKR